MPNGINGNDDTYRLRSAFRHPEMCDGERVHSPSIVIWSSHGESEQMALVHDLAEAQSAESFVELK